MRSFRANLLSKTTGGQTSSSRVSACLTINNTSSILLRNCATSSSTSGSASPQSNNTTSTKTSVADEVTTSKLQREDDESLVSRFITFEKAAMAVRPIPTNEAGAATQDGDEGLDQDKTQNVFSSSNNNNNNNNNNIVDSTSFDAESMILESSHQQQQSQKRFSPTDGDNQLLSQHHERDLMLGMADFGGMNNNNNNNGNNLMTGSSSSNVIEAEDPGLIFAAEMLCDDLLTCKTEVLRQFARSRGAKSVAKANIVSELVEIASKTVSSPQSRSIARRILGSEIELPKAEGVRSAWTNETLEASMLENAASKKAKFAQHNFGANLRAASARVSPISQRLLRALQDDFTSVSHAAVKGVHREYVESAKQILQRHETNMSSLVATFSTLLAHRVESSEVQEFISSADIQSKAIYLGLNRPTIETDIILPSSSTSSPDGVSGGGATGAADLSATNEQIDLDSSGANTTISTSSNINNTTTAAGGTDLSSLSSLSSASSMSQQQHQHQRPTTTLDHLMSMLDNVVAEVKMRQSEIVKNTRTHGVDTKESFRRSLAAFKQRQVSVKRDAVAVRRALADVPQWVIEMARQFEVWETLVRSDIEDLRRAPSEIFDLILVNVAASVASEKLHDDDNSSSNHSHEKGTSIDMMSSSNSNSNTVPGHYRQALRAAIEEFADEGSADTIVLRLNAYSAGKQTYTVNRPVIRQNLFRSIHVMMHGMVTDDVADPPFERVVMILQEFTKTIHRSERIASLYHLLVQLTESMHFHLRFAQVFNKLSESDKNIVRQGNRSLELPLSNFEQQQGVQPIPVNGVAFFCIVMLYFCIRSPAAIGVNSSGVSGGAGSGLASAGTTSPTAIPIATRLESCTGIDELAIITLTSLKSHSIRGLQVSHPPRMSYTSWIDAAENPTSQTAASKDEKSSAEAAAAAIQNESSSSSSSSSVYRLLPSDAVKSSTSNLMLTSRAPIIRSLDAISRVPWRINKMMLHVQEAILQEGYAFGKIRASFYPLAYARMQSGEITIASPYSSPSSTSYNSNANFAEAKTPKNGSVNNNNNNNNNNNSTSSFKVVANDPHNQNSKRKLFSHRLQRKHVEEQNRNWRELLDTRSPRVHHIQALRQARALVNVAKIYFPNNMDFRGRMYPMPGRLNHTGSDPFRASLEFAEPKPLGPDGLYWLKVHLANKMGQTKLSFADRVRWVDEHISDVVQSAEAPLSGDRWWQEGDEPFQALNACKELADALKHSTGPENFLSRLPVAVDGSYNGLQHYSAIGRDEAGGALVNLVPQKLPSDAYTGILKEMMKEIIADAAKDHAVAQRCIGSGRGMDKNHVRRKTIKQSIMTQVYGVTEFGMAEQIRTQLLNQNKAHGLWTDAEITEMSTYLRDKVNESLGVTFRQTQECRTWLGQVSAMIWKCQPAELRNAFSWTTPLGLIVRQPYRKGIETSVFTPVGYTRIKGSPLEPASPKQMSALAPNLIHSLDATHLAMTALEMQNLGLSMMAVHDSFWTYACDLPTLSRVLREQFLELYTNFDPLVELKQQWEEMFFMDLRRHSVVLPDPPKRGTLDLKQVLKSPYFFS